MHGHSYRVEVGLFGPVDPKTGWLVDFAAIDEMWRPLFRQLDHQTLNDVPGLENPTCEILCGYIWSALAGKVPHLAAITVWETPDSCCTFRGEVG